MNYSVYIAKHLKEVHTGGNWTWSNMKDVLSDITREEAFTKIGTINTIAVLTYHINYYVRSITRVLEGKPLDSSDETSFECPVMNDEEWEQMKKDVLEDGEKLADLIAAFPDSKLEDDFVDPKYRSYFRNFHGLIEHTHYHLGQIAILKKLVRTSL